MKTWMTSMNPQINCSVILIGLLVTVVMADSNKLCDEGAAIHSADRHVKSDAMGDPNEYYRVFRGSYYWELIGLPDPQSVKVKGPFNVSDLPYKGIQKFDLNKKILTIGSGPLKGYVYQFQGREWWRWPPTGGLADGHSIWDNINDHWDAVYNDGDLDRKGEPRSIAFFETNRVNYWRTTGYVWTPTALPWKFEGHEFGGLGEHFPIENSLTAAMPYNDNSGKYHVFLFKYYDYCYRPYNGVNGCPDGWKRNWDLFGCKGTFIPPKIDNSSKTTTSKPAPGLGTQNGDQREAEERTTALNVIAILISLMFYYLL